MIRGDDLDLMEQIRQVEREADEKRKACKREMQDYLAKRNKEAEKRADDIEDAGREEARRIRHDGIAMAEKEEENLIAQSREATDEAMKNAHDRARSLVNDWLQKGGAQP